MTPLLWAFPDNKLDRFKRLLEQGADPNVVIESDFNTRSAISAGDSVTHLVCKTSFPGYFEAVFNNGGDSNLINAGPGKLHDSPLLLVIKFGGVNKKEQIRFLLKKGADINHVNGTGATPTIQAVSWGGQYDIALMLLRAGADHRVYVPMSNSRLIHVILREDRRKSAWTPQQAADYQELVKWLDDHGESLENARSDAKRWDSWSRTTGEYRRQMDAEIAERKAREAREKTATQKPANEDK